MLDLHELKLPTPDHPNPIVQMNCMRIILSNNQQRIIEFPDEASALAAQALFEDMFFNRLDQEVTSLNERE